MMGDHAIYHDGWIASTKVIRPPWEVVGPVNQDPFNNVTWELYDLTQGLDAVRRRGRRNIPAKLKELKELFVSEATQVSGAAAGRLGGDAPGAAAARTSPPAAPSSSIPGR